MDQRSNPKRKERPPGGGSDQVFPVVVLSGGLATRLRPITETIPKCLVEVNGTPFIDIQLRQLASEGVTKVIVLVGYLGEMVQDYVGDGSRYGVQVTFVPDGPQLLGTAGALRAALAALPERFFVLYGDSYLRCSYKSIQQRYLESGLPALMTVFKNSGQWDTSNVKFVNGMVEAYSKRNLTPDMDYIDYGLMILSRDIVEGVPAGAVYDLGSVLENAVKLNKVQGFEVVDRFYEIGSHEGLRDLIAFLGESGATKCEEQRV